MVAQRIGQALRRPLGEARRGGAAGVCVRPRGEAGEVGVAVAVGVGFAAWLGSFGWHPILGSHCPMFQVYMFNVPILRTSTRNELYYNLVVALFWGGR